MSKLTKLVAKIGLTIDELRALVKRDELYIRHLIIIGNSREDAEEIAFVEDIEHLLGLMKKNKCSAQMAAQNSSGEP
jgi:hypothetical protein